MTLKYLFSWCIKSIILLFIQQIKNNLKNLFLRFHLSTAGLIFKQKFTEFLQWTLNFFASMWFSTSLLNLKIGTLLLLLILKIITSIQN